MGDLFLKPQRGSDDKLRGLSANIWSQSPLTQIRIGALDEGYGFIDDFLSLDLSESGAAADGSDLTVAGNWCLTAATAGTAALDAAAKGGVLLLDSASSTNNQGAQIQMGGAAGAASFIPNANATIYYEARVKIADIGSTTCQMFAGLAIVDTSLFASAANSTANHIGFEAINTTAMGIHSEKAGSRSSTAAVHTVADDAYVKLGFVVDGLTKITPYVNGVAKDAITTNIPIVELTPSFVCHSSGTTDPILHIDWVAVYQAEQIAN
tara:strand:- start:2612 stop:3409 length:798 start_codon:yes stop_codon:yes gene_type:complete